MWLCKYICFRQGEIALKNKTKTKTKSKLRTIIPLMFIFAGLIVAAFPLAGPIINQIEVNKIINNYQSTVTNMSKTEIKKIKEAAVKYNETGDTGYYEAVDINKVISYIEIPCIDVYLPIYDSTSADTLNQGIGHLKNSSLPVGGKGTHCVLTGHSGLTTRTMFSNLEKMKKGDKFYLHTLDETLCYEVYNIVTVLPDEAKSHLRSNISEDLCTLITCTPIGVNTHRLLVQGKRTDYVEEPTSEEESKQDNKQEETIDKSKVAEKIKYEEKTEPGVFGMATITVVLFVSSIVFVIVGKHIKKKRLLDKEKTELNSEISE